MRPFFLIISLVYIFAIFFWADSPVVQVIGAFNPYSLLHIPLYAVLTFLLMWAFRSPGAKVGLKRIVLIICGVGLVAVLDEFHQSFLPTRDASVTDVALDLVGISVAAAICRWAPWAAVLPWRVAALLRK